MAGNGAKMRWVLASGLAVLASPALAWEFTETSVCTVSHSDPQAEVVLTFDPATGVYDIAMTLEDDTWPEGSQFRILFEGPNTLAIGTDQQVISDDGRRLNVSDSGFGNVLDGVQFNDQMTAALGALSVVISLDGAAEPLAAFRLCPSIATS